MTPLSFLYDSHGRLQQTTQGTRIWQTGYDANGYPNTQIDPLNQSISTSNDLDGRPLLRTLQDLREVGTSWDGDSDMSSVTLPGALAAQPPREHEFSYTPVDLTQTYTPPAIASGLPSTTYSYDLDRFLTTIARPDGVVVTRVPDTFERLSQVTYPQGTIGYAYSPSTGQLHSTTMPAGETTTFAYDGFLQQSITWSGPVAGSITFGYNSDFRANSQSLNGGPGLSFGYDNDGLLNLAGLLTIVPDPQNGRLSATTLGAVSDAYSYNSFGQFAAYSASYNGTPIYTETIVSRDLNGRITEKTDALEGTTHDWVYGYDLAGRLTDVTEDGTHVSHYGYDGEDNRVGVGVTSVTQPTYDVQDRLSTYPSLNASYAFTANGELTSKTVAGQVTSYTYDALGNLLNVTLPAPLADGVQTIGYIVDGQNRRIGKQVNGSLTMGWLYQDQLRPVAQLDGANNVVARFVYATRINVPDYMVTSGGTYRILGDHLGSPRAVVDVATGNLIETLNFDEFGNETDTLAGTLPTGYVRIPFGFAGGLYDPDTGFVRFGARDYDASVGRWTAKDPLRFGGAQLNLYVYTGNDPINWLDPTGLDFQSAAQCFANGALYGALGAIVVAGVRVAAASVLPVAAVTAALSLAAVVAGSYLGYDVGVSAYNGNWDEVAYDAGSLLGGAVTGGISGRATAEAINGVESPPWSLSSDWSQRYNKTLGSPSDFFDTGFSPASAGAASAVGGAGAGAASGIGCSGCN